MAGLVDGMGGEEVNQEVTTTEIISGTNVYGSVAVTAPIINNAAGALKFVAAGVVACGAGSDGTVEFDTNLPSTTWAIGFATSGATTSATLPTISGALNVSGAEVIGDASTSYYFTAVSY